MTSEVEIKNDYVYPSIDLSLGDPDAEKPPFIKRIISFINDGICKEDDLIENLATDKNDSEHIKRLIDDLLDNEDIVEAKGISGRFLCSKDKEEEYKLAFEAISSTFEESGFFDNWFSS